MESLGEKLYNYSKIKERIRGPVFSIVTPFAEDESIDFSSLEKYVKYAFSAGARAFYVMGYNSRFSELSWDEIATLNSYVTRLVKNLDENNLVIVADPLHCSTRVSLEFAKKAEQDGADIISLICREKYYSDEQIYAHFEFISSQSKIGLLIHEMPFLSGYGGPSVNWPIGLLDRLADMENIVAIKEDAKDDDYSREVIEKIRDRVSIIISGGGKRQWLRFSELGCQSWLNGIGVFEPKLAVNFWKAYQNQDKDFINQMVEEIEVPFFDQAVKKYGWHLTIKAALEARGWMSRRERLPLMELSNEKAHEVAELIKKLPIDKFTDY